MYKPSMFIFYFWTLHYCSKCHAHVSFLFYIYSVYIYTLVQQIYHTPNNSFKNTIRIIKSDLTALKSEP